MKAVIINESMTLDQKLAAIDAALLAAQPAFVNDKGKTVCYPAVDPAELTMCIGCQ